MASSKRRVVPAQATATASVVLLHWREADSAQAELVALARGSLSQIVREWS